MLAQCRQNIEIFNLSSGRQATVGPTLAKSAEDATNIQSWQNLSTIRPTANVGLTVECYLGSPLVVQTLFHADSFFPWTYDILFTLRMLRI